MHIKSLRTESSKGWNEVILFEDCGYKEFYQATRLLEQRFNIRFTSKADDFDALYWNFSFNGNDLTLHYAIYLELRLFPSKLEDATIDENKAALKVGELLYKEGPS